MLPELKALADAKKRLSTIEQLAKDAVHDGLSALAPAPLQRLRELLNTPAAAAPAGGSLFGGAAAAPASGGGFFSFGGGTAAPAGGSLFGGAAPTVSLFGAQSSIMQTVESPFGGVAPTPFNTPRDVQMDDDAEISSTGLSEL